ncbi:hypothetical protein KC19_6G130400 [Ceratodon purpureus]|uniref:Protein kinase domain-containing protein n=1 Tax=Ceratodon purpureus TaxID=3225 RepID=A0A8T0HDV0_CERPU|nr:hypothetical protein KC19_6G130400 [Ceratodon purpureus]
MDCTMVVYEIFKFLFMRELIRNPSPTTNHSHVNFMQTSFSDALDIINRVNNLRGSFQINQNQCAQLVDFYNHVGQALNSFDKYFDDGAPIFTGCPWLPSVTISVLQQGFFLLKKYTEVDWFGSIVTAGVNQNSFLAIQMELKACIWSSFENYCLHARGYHIEYELRKQRIWNQLQSLVPLHYFDEDKLFELSAEMDKRYTLEKMKSWKLEIGNSETIISSILGFLFMKRSALKDFLASDILVSGKMNHSRPATSEIQELPHYLMIESSEIDVLDRNRIGRGGFAEVFKCRWLQREYAVKILHPNDMIGLRKELQIELLPLRHPNIVQLVGFAYRKSDKSPMVVMELLDGDLQNVVSIEHNPDLHGNPLLLSLGVNFMHQIATGMSYLHKMGILHGDLKGKNVLFRCYPGDLASPCYVLKITDFGTTEKADVGNDIHAGYESDNTSFTTANAGTTRWRAPEVFGVKGSPELLLPYSLKADVYSFAMTCVEILTGKKPFPDLTELQVKKYVPRGGRPTLPTTVPEDLKNLLVRCWSQNPSSRPDFPAICVALQKLVLE